MNYLRKNFPSFIIGIIIGVPIALYGVNHQTPTTIPVHYESTMVEEAVIEEPNIEQKESINFFAPKVKQPKLTYLPVKLSNEEQEVIFEISNKYGIAYTLIFAVIEHESECDPDVVSSTGDYGLMQINQINHETLKTELGINDFTDIRQNVEAGCYMFNELFKKYEEENLVLMAYNMGEKGASDLWKQGIYSSNYTDEIIQREFELSQYVDERNGVNAKVDDN